MPEFGWNQPAVSLVATVVICAIAFLAIAKYVNNFLGKLIGGAVAIVFLFFGNQYVVSPIIKILIFLWQRYDY